MFSLPPFPPPSTTGNNVSDANGEIEQKWNLKYDGDPLLLFFSTRFLKKKKNNYKWQSSSFWSIILWGAAVFWKDMAAAATIGGGNKTKFREFQSLWQIGIDAEIQFWKMLKLEFMRLAPTVPLSDRYSLASQKEKKIILYKGLT